MTKLENQLIEKNSTRYYIMLIMIFNLQIKTLNFQIEIVTDVCSAA